MTTYNSSQYVVDTINSVLNQSLSNFDFVIVDDGSTDNTVDIIKKYNDSRIRLFCRSENKGVGYSLKEAIEYVHTPYVIKVDSDDLSHPERFTRQLSFLMSNPAISLVKSYFEYFADSPEVAASERFISRQRDACEINKINTEALIRENLPRWLCVEHTTYCARTDAIKAVGYPDQRLCEDYALFYQLHRHGYRMDCLPEYLVKMRLSNSSVTAGLTTERLYSWFSYLFELKKERILQLLGGRASLAIYGSGGLARCMHQVLTAQGIQVTNFIEQTTKPDVLVNGQLLPVKALRDCLQQRILIAAQPVRLQLVQQLTDFGLVEWHDFMVIA
ncbi:hypothetical protein WH43_10190 [Rheinheimera sp. KL1]|nr:hypothetical protein WH43_10190 [Rheinheimera sp. KL1]